MFSTIDTVNFGIPPDGQRQQPPAAPAENQPKPEAAAPGVKRQATRVMDRQAADTATSASARREAEKDQAELNLALSREEREAFAATLGKNGAKASEEERATAQKAAERITKHLDETLARKAENREKVEKAVSEWYAKMTKGEHRSPTELVDLLHRAAKGDFSSSAT